MVDNLVSIIMPSYNTAQYITESINSVLAQTYQDWELIIVDDCSTDNTIEVLRQFSDKRICVFVNDISSGAAVTRNRAIKEAKGRYLAFLDSDDLWSPDKLEKQIAFMKQNDYSFSYTKYEQIDELSNLLGIEVGGPMVVDSEKIILCNWLGCLTVMYDVEKIGKVYSPNVRSRNDYAMWLQIAKKSPCILLQECLAKYRVHTSGSLSTVGVKKLIKAHYHLFFIGLGMSRFESFFWTLVNCVCAVYKKNFYVRELK